MRISIVALLCTTLIACAPSGRYSQRDDSTPKRISADIDFRNASPVYETYLPASMRPYRVLGKHYTPLQTGKGYTSEGIASWYGQKFHGHLTANGEVYNMFAMTAAHKTLPLPSYVRVTNLDNNKQAVVRVNDRGPFHDNRVIDLSYAAAMKLNFLDSGTANVKLDIMYVTKSGQLLVGSETHMETDASRQQSKTSKKLLYVQVVALQDEQRIANIAMQMTQKYAVPISMPLEKGLTKLQLGPFENELVAADIIEKLKSTGYTQAFRVYKATK